MAHIAGTKQGTRLWRRCPFCGDSPKHPNRAHLFIDLTTLGYHCYRCGESGLLPLSTIIELFESGEFTQTLKEAQEYKKSNTNQLEEYSKRIIPGPGTPRHSSLERYHHITDQGEALDVFLVRDLLGEVVGYHFRGGKGEDKVSFHIGERGYGYSGPEFPDPPIVLVEGPYDVQYPEEVCTFGLFSRKILADLRGYPLILCPDGDVWERTNLTENLIKNVKISKAWVIGFQYLAPDQDPEDVPIDQRHFMSLEGVKKAHERRKLKESHFPGRSSRNG